MPLYPLVPGIKWNWNPIVLIFVCGIVGLWIIAKIPYKFIMGLK